ncbi:hypothetical protein [Kribbella pratensis]|uniref:hypothetical protein n=1 Tax=Kribbella pratensis TaxID=2512112 RepID=UPI0035CCA4DC
MYYKRTFTVPAGWSGRHVQLNFGAVRWQSKVWVYRSALDRERGVRQEQGSVPGRREER